jgi:hypothetical protein
VNSGSGAVRVVAGLVVLAVLLVVVVLDVVELVDRVVESLLVVVSASGGALDTDTVLVPEPQPPSSVPPTALRAKMIVIVTARRISLCGYSSCAGDLLEDSSSKRYLEALLDKHY